MITFSANVTTGSATFIGDAVNAGEITGNAVFKNNSVNNGTIIGNAVFKDNSKNKETVTGNAEFFDDSKNGDEPLINNDEPLLCGWYTASSGGNKLRRLICRQQRNPDKLSETIFGGRWQACPSAGCFKSPATYRPLAEVDYVLDYEINPDYERE